MSEYVLLKSTEPKGAALYRDEELVATWDKHDPDDYVAAQVAAKAGDAEVVERKWGSEDWPYDLPNAPAGKKRTSAREPAPADPAVEGGDA